MQTESAKRIIDSNPEEAKAKIVAANLQAKHALEELRNSVHLLSGVQENMTLKSALLAIIHESMDGTGIVIRSEIEEVAVGEKYYRFLCNALREGISNGIRHGGATAFWFELKSLDKKVSFLLSDNGKGVDGEVQMGFGLRMMKERAGALGGALTIVTGIEEGFEFHLELPIEE
jgi:signal transduction histidine kinase